MKSDIGLRRKQHLIKEGWKELKSEFDINYLISLNPLEVIQNIGFLFSSLSEVSNKNPLGFLSNEVHEARESFIKSLCPPNLKPSISINVPMLSSSWPLIKKDYENAECAFQELSYTLIKRIIKNLDTPIKIIQYNTSEESNDLFYYPLDNYNPGTLDCITIFKKVYVEWNNIYLMIDCSNRWSDNGTIVEYTWNLYSRDLKTLIGNAMTDIGLELNPNTYQLGTLAPQYTLDSFPQYIKNYEEEVYDDIFINTNNSFNSNDYTFIDRYNLIIEGPPGMGKSCWAQAFANEQLAPKGYLIISIDYNALQDLIIPDYVDKVCLIVNDADTLALNREFSKRGETEQILSWLDGTRTSFIQPFHFDRRTSVITIMTANSISNWDEAALRQGRIHKIVKFDKVKLCDK